MRNFILMLVVLTAFGCTKNNPPTVKINPLKKNLQVGQHIFADGIIMDEEDLVTSIDVEWFLDSKSIYKGFPTKEGYVNVQILDNDLSVGNHTFKLVATDSEGEKGLDVLNFTISEGPVYIEDFKISQNRYGVFLSWHNTSSSLTRSEVWRAENENGPFEKIAELDSYADDYQDKTTELGIIYYYKVASVDANRAVGFGEVKSIKRKYDYLSFDNDIVQLLVDEKRPYYYALLQKESKLLVINRKSLDIEKAIFVGSLPSNMVIDEAGRMMYVANHGSSFISKIDLDAQEKIEDILVPKGEGGNPSQVALLENDILVYAGDNQHCDVIFFDLNAKKVVGKIPNMYSPYLIASIDPKTLYVSDLGDLHKIEKKNDTFEVVQTKSFTEQPDKICLTKNGDYLFYGMRKLTTSNFSEIGIFDGDYIFACTTEGDIVIGADHLWDANKFEIIKNGGIGYDGVVEFDPEYNYYYYYHDNELNVVIYK